MSAELAMFPLGTVLLPEAVLPLHVFEDRYRVLVDRCLAGDRQFGVVLIERGSEVGGGDVRTSVGTVAEIAQARQLPDGRWLIVAVGRQRLTVATWLPDDPHPRARVDVVDDGAPPTPSSLDALAGATTRILALRSELGEWDGPIEVELPSDGNVALWRLAALVAPGPLDAQRLLEAPDGQSRAAALAAVADEQQSLLELRLGGGPG